MDDDVVEYQSYGCKRKSFAKQRQTPKSERWRNDSSDSTHWRGANIPTDTGNRRGSPPCPHRAANCGPLSGSDDLVGEEDEAVTEDARVDEAHGFRVTGLAEEALARPEHDWIDGEPQFVDEVVLDQRMDELSTGVDDDVASQLLLELPDLGRRVSGKDRRVAPLGLVH